MKKQKKNRLPLFHLLKIKSQRTENNKLLTSFNPKDMTNPICSEQTLTLQSNRAQTAQQF